MNLMMLLEMASSGFGERTAVGPQGQGLTYEQLFQRSGAAATRFREAGIDRVSMVDISSEALPIALFGSAWAGVPFVPLNYRLTVPELRHLAAEVAPSVTVCNDEAEAAIGDLDGVLAVVRPDFLAQWAEGSAPDSDWNADPEEIAILLYTSGTTGAPKAAVLRHKHLVSYIIGSVEFMGAGEDEATLVSVPPYHVAGIAAILSSVYAGRRIVQLPNFDAADWVDLARAEGVTHAMVVPTMLARIVDHLEEVGGGLPTLRALSYGGGKMPAPVIARALDLLPETNFVNAYGLTETSSTVAVLGPEEHREAHRSDDPAVRSRLGSAGRPLPTIEVDIRDDEGEQAQSSQVEPEGGGHLFHSIGAGCGPDNTCSRGQQSSDLFQPGFAAGAGRQDKINAVQAADSPQQLLCSAYVDDQQTIQRPPAQLVRWD